MARFSSYVNTENQGELLEVMFSCRTVPLLEHVYLSERREWDSQESRKQTVIKKVFDALSEADMLEHAVELYKSRLSEITKLFDLQCFARCPRSEAQKCLGLSMGVSMEVNYRKARNQIKDDAEGIQGGGQ